MWPQASSWHCHHTNEPPLRLLRLSTLTLLHAGQQTAVIRHRALPGGLMGS
jgi:hypothetical protein